jgi:hypothetical protein
LAGHRRENTPAEIVAKLNQAINAGLSDAEMKARLINRGGYIASSGSPADFSKLIADYTERWGKVIRAANIRLTDPGNRADTAIRPSRRVAPDSGSAFNSEGRITKTIDRC